MDAQLADNATSDMRNAAAKCDRNAYEAALNSLNAQISMYNNENPVVSDDKGRQVVAQSKRDAAGLLEVVNQRPPFPANCTPPSNAYNPGPFSIFVIGGGFVPPNSSGSVTGVDTFFGAGNFLIDNRTNGASSNAVPIVGARIRNTWLEQDNWNYVLGRHQLKAGIPPTFQPPNYGSRVSFFVESGVQTSFGAQSFIQPFGGVSTTPQGFGSSTVKENFQIPILAGVGLPLSGPGATPVFLDLYGGITISNSTQTLQGGELGAPNGRGFFAESKRTTVDPTIGTGVRAVITDFSGGALPPLIIGANAEFSFRSGNVVQAQSPNFPSQSYYGTVDPRANAAFTVRVGIPFGGTR